MSRLTAALSRRLRRFCRNRSGSMLVESIFIIPVMGLGMTGFFTFWDAYRTQNEVQKATYAVADMLSREMVPATPAFIDGLDRIVDYLINENARIRVTSIRRTSDGPTGVTGLDVLWSYSPGSLETPLTEATLPSVVEELPMMAIGSNVVLFEVTVPYTPLTDILEVATLTERVAMRPRFLPTLCMNTSC